MKNLLKKSGDPYLALLAYRSTPLEVGYSPAELLMSRRLRTTVPDIQKQRQPSIPDSSAVVVRDDRAKKRQKDKFDAHRGARKLPVLEPGNTVWVTDCKSHGEVVEETSPRSYIIQTPEGVFHRNRRQIIASPEKISYPQLAMPEEKTISTKTGTMTGTVPSLKVYTTRSQSGHPPKPPNRLDTSWT